MSELKKTLLINTASEQCFLNTSGGKQNSLMKFNNGRETDQFLFEKIKVTLDKAGLKKNELELIATTNGPGSFTGLRVGLSVGFGLSFGLSIPLVCISNFEIINLLLENTPKEYSIVIKNYNNSYFCQRYSNKLPLNNAILIDDEELSQENKVFTEDDIITKLPNSAHLISELFAKNLLKVTDNIIPYYLAEPKAKESTFKGFFFKNNNENQP